MKNSLILHHYDMSPYAEKIRLMFGLTNTHWCSLRSPVQPPRPSLDPLTGGYRRIPVLQIGADIFCDTALIAQEVALATDCPELDPTMVDASAADLMEKAEKETFFAAVGSIQPWRQLGTMVKLFGPVGAYRFVKDRASLMKGGSARPPTGTKAKALFESLLEELEKRLDQHPWVRGSAPSVADFTVYHPLWLNVMCNRRPLKAGPKVQDWYQRISHIGHGQREEITQEKAFAVAREAQPRPLPTSVGNVPIAIGDMVEVAPLDYGLVPVSGVLAAVTEERIIITRETSEFGMINVHFPFADYSLVAKCLNDKSSTL